MLVYIPNTIYLQCNFKDESYEEFIKSIIKEVCVVDGVDKHLVEYAITRIKLLDVDLVLDNLYI